MTQNVQVGTILIEDRPRVTRILDLESESYSGNWNVVKAIDGFALDLKVHAAGWSFFFMAEEVKATVFGSLVAKNIQKALKRICLKVRKQDFNCLEVTKMVENRFLGVPYITVCTHPRHIQQGCWLDSAQERAAARQKEIEDSCGTVHLSIITGVFVIRQIPLCLVTIKSETPIWFAGPDLIASVIRTSKVPQVIRAIRMVPQGKQAGMKTVNLRKSMVQIDPYRDDLFRKIIEQRKLHKADKALYYWLKILANSIYGFFVELNPDIQTRNVPVNVFSGEKEFPDSSDVIENPGPWFFPPLASLITAGGRLLLAMTEACVEKKQGTYLFCDTDSLAVVASEHGGPLHIPGSEGLRILSWKDVQTIVDMFADLNPYDRKIVKGSILNLVDANYVDSDPNNPQRQLYGYSIAAKRYTLHERIGKRNIKIIDPKAHGIGFLYPPKDSPKGWEEDVPKWTYEMWDYIVRGALKLKRKAPTWLDIPQMMRLTITTYNVLEMLGEWESARPYNFLLLPMVDPTFGYSFDRRANEKVLLIAPFSSKQERWFDMECLNVHSGKSYKMVDCGKEKNPPHNVVFPSQFARLLIEYQEHPERKSLAPDGTPCEAGTCGLLQRADVIAGDLRYVGKETDRKWEEGDDFSVLDFKTTEYGREKKVVPDASTAAEIRKIGIRKTMNLTNMSQHTIEKLVRGEAVRRRTREYVVKAIQVYKSKIEPPQSSRPVLVKPITGRARPHSKNQNTITSIVKKAA